MSNTGTGGMNPIAGIGVTPQFREPGDKRFSSKDCLEALIDRITNNPEIVQNQFNITSREESGEMRLKFWPALLDASQWERISTHRPTKDENGESLGGTNREVRTYENNYWMDNYRHMVAKVTTEFGEVSDISVEARW